MAENSTISWTDHTFNPWIGCSKVGPGCDHCYAETWDARGLSGGPSRWGVGAPRTRTSAANWQKPRQWERKARVDGNSPWVFCASLADVFDNEVDPAWRADLWTLIRETPALRWILVTKRIGNAAKMLPPDWTSGAFPHVGLMSTIVNQTEADRDIPKLLATPAAWRGLSMEPLLGDVQLRRLRISRGVQLDALTGRFEVFTSMLGGFASAQQAISALPALPARLPELDWIIIGGESGPGARPMHPDWVRSLRDQCVSVGIGSGVPFHFKQWGEWARHAPYAGGDLGGDLRRGIVAQVCSDRDNDGHFRRGDVYMRRSGKKAAGRLLDGVEHNGMPEVAQRRCHSTALITERERKDLMAAQKTADAEVKGGGP